MTLVEKKSTKTTIMSHRSGFNVKKKKKSSFWLKGKRKEKPKIVKSYQFGNGHSGRTNNAALTQELSLTLIMRRVC